MESIALPKQFTPAVGQSQCFVIIASGKNMMPLISDGDYLICIKTTNLIEGDIAILQKDKKYHCKYYREIKNQPFYEDKNKDIFNHEGWLLIAKVSGIFKRLCII